LAQELQKESEHLSPPQLLSDPGPARQIKPSRQNCRRRAADICLGRHGVSAPRPKWKIGTKEKSGVKARALTLQPARRGKKKNNARNAMRARPEANFDDLQGYTNHSCGLPPFGPLPKTRALYVSVSPPQHFSCGHFHFGTVTDFSGLLGWIARASGSPRSEVSRSTALAGA